MPYKRTNLEYLGRLMRQPKSANASTRAVIELDGEALYIPDGIARLLLTWIDDVRAGSAATERVAGDIRIYSHAVAENEV